MNLREKIGKMPAWKAAIIFLLAFVFVLAAVEEFFVSRVFGVMGNMITAFEKEKKADMEEWNQDRYKENAL